MTRLALAYHAVTGDWRHPLAVEAESLARQLDALARRGYRGVTLSELAAAHGGRLVAVTFDDGLRSVLDGALPVLAERGWPATVYAVTDFVESGDPLPWLGGAAEPEAPRRPLGWDGLEALAAAGWEIGSHTRTHRLLSRLPPAEVEDELARSRDALERRLGRCASISYPWGELDSAVVAAARRAGYTSGSGLAGRFRRGDPLTVPRVAVARGDDGVRFAVKSSRAFFALRSTALWDAADAARRRRRPLGV